MARQNDLLMDISILYRSTQKYYDKKQDKIRLSALLSWPDIAVAERAAVLAYTGR